MPKLFYIIAVLIILVAGGTAVYFGYFVPSQAVKDNTSNSKELKVLFQDKAISPVSSYSNQGLWFGTEAGRLMTYDFNAEAITEHPVPQVLGSNFKKIFWPRKGNDFIALSMVEGSDQYSYFSSADSRYYVLPTSVINLDWMESGRQIVLTWKTEESQTLLVVASPDASGYKVINQLPWPDMVIKASPVADTALMYRANSSGPLNKIYLFDLLSGEYQEIIAEGRSTGAIWSPNGNGFVYSQLVANKNKIYYYNLDANSTTDLGLATSIDKVSFNTDGSVIFAATTRSDDTGEDIWEYQIDSSFAQVVFSSETLRAKNIIIIGQKLFFLANDGMFYSYQR